MSLDEFERRRLLARCMQLEAERESVNAETERLRTRVAELEAQYQCVDCEHTRDVLKPLLAAADAWAALPADQQGWFIREIGAMQCEVHEKDNATKRILLRVKDVLDAAAKRGGT